MVYLNLSNICSSSSTLRSLVSDLLASSVISFMTDSRTFIISITFKIGAMPFTKSAISLVKIYST